MPSRLVASYRVSKAPTASVSKYVTLNVPIVCRVITKKFTAARGRWSLSRFVAHSGQSKQSVTADILHMARIPLWRGVIIIVIIIVIFRYTRK